MILIILGDGVVANVTLISLVEELVPFNHACLGLALILAFVSSSVSRELQSGSTIALAAQARAIFTWAKYGTFISEILGGFLCWWYIVYILFKDISTRQTMALRARFSGTGSRCS